MNYRIVRKTDNGNQWWSTCEGWTTLENSEWLDDSDIDVLMPHFGRHHQVAAISKNELLIGWAMTGEARTVMINSAQ